MTLLDPTLVEAAAVRARRRAGAMAARFMAWAYVGCFPLLVAAFVVQVVGIALIPITAGIALLFVALPCGRWLADLHRRMAGAVLGEPVLSLYRTPRAVTKIGRVLEPLRDPQRWRDLLWLLFAMIVGFALSIISLVFFLAIFWYAIFPFLFWVTPAGVFDTNYGVFHLERQRDSFAMWAFVPIAFALWWWVVPQLMRARAVVDRALLGPISSAREQLLEARVQHLAGSRADTLDVQAAELRRIERDLHDGAQARVVSTGMTLGMAIDALDRDPAQAKALLQEARETNRDALSDLRTVVRGIHPPVLADRGLAGAVEALAMQMPVTTHVSTELAGRPPAPVESAVYFALAECLTNVAKHAHAQQVTVTLRHDGEQLHAVVSDDGVGGAHLDPAGGLDGLVRRLAAFDGTLHIDSPAGGPTRVDIMVPCALSSPKI